MACCGWTVGLLLLFEVADPSAAKHMAEIARILATLPNLMVFEYSAALGLKPLTC